MKLTPEQDIALAEMLEFADTIESNPGFHLFTGSAGTGKTTVIQFLTKSLEKDIKVWLTAPTNKAVKVLRSMARTHNLSPECCTIHKLLGLRMTTKEGKQTLVEGRDGIPDFPSNSLIIIDEASMIDTELLRFITQAGTSVIFMGDKYQLPPVGEKVSPVFTLEECSRSALTTVVRQAQGNPVLALCTQLRDEIASLEQTGVRDPYKPVAGILSDFSGRVGNLGVHIRNGTDFIANWMPQSFNHERFNDNSDSVRIIAWRNKTVHAYNSYIQSVRYPNASQPFSMAEPVVFSDPLQRISNRIQIDSQASLLAGETWDDIICSTETEGVVREVHEQEMFVFAPDAMMQAKSYTFAPIAVRQYKITVELEDKTTVVCTMTPDREEMDKIFSLLVKACQARITPWWRFWQLKGYFCNIRPVYALTAHKSQGSTFTNIFVDAGDILTNPNAEEALRCLYVAISRARENVVLKLF